MFASLIAFVSAGIRPASPLARAIVVVLAIKLVAIAVMLMVPSISGRQPVDAGTIGRLFSPTSQR